MAKKRILSLHLLFFISFCLIFSSGRLGSGDGIQQLRATFLYVNTGSFGSLADFGKDNWVFDGKSRYYEVHDFGANELMLPVAFLISHLPKSKQGPVVSDVPTAAHALTTLEYSLIAGIGWWFLLRFLLFFYPLRRSFFLTLLFVFATFWFPYARCASDVLPETAFVILLLYSMVFLLRSSGSLWPAALCGFAAGETGCFRYTFLPFLCLGLLIFVVLNRRKISVNQVIVAFAFFDLFLAPTLVYNYVRMGSPFIPATMAPQFLFANGLSGHPIKGLLLLLLSPNHGLVFFAPIVLVLPAIGMVWKKLAEEYRTILLAFTVSVAGYLAMIGSIKNWPGIFAYGPRYLLPVLPIIFIGVAAVFEGLWEKNKKVLMGLAIVSFLINFPAMISNWYLSTLICAPAMQPEELRPMQILSDWKCLMMSLIGRPLTHLDGVSDSAASGFPDIWTVRLMELSLGGKVVGVFCLLFLIVVCLYSVWGAWKTMQRLEN